MNWISKLVGKTYSPSKSVDETNGLILNNVPLPEEIILIILSYTDIKTALKCRLVCQNWKEIIESHHFWRMRLAPKNKVIRSKHPWYVYYKCYKMLNTNLLKNGNGENGFKYWMHVDHGGDGWKVENPPSGADELPNQPEFNGYKSCFSTSYGVCTKSQIIPIKRNSVLREILNEYQPTIYVSEWFAGRFDCGCMYKLGVRLHNKNQKYVFEKEEERTISQWDGKAWEKVEIKCEKYGKDIDAIEFYHVGCDTQFWKGNYGSKMAGGVVKILFDFI